MRSWYEYPDGYCVSCTYFEEYSEPDLKSENMRRKGLCRRHAPSPDHIYHEMAWPEVLHNDWCGEYVKHE